MKKVLRFLWLLLLVCCFASAHGQVKKTTRVKPKKVKAVSRNSVERRSRCRMHITAFTRLYFDTLAVDTLQRIPFKPHFSNSFPQFRMFDCRTGLGLAAWAAGEGPACVYRIYDTFPPRNIHPMFANQALDDCTQYLHNNNYTLYQPQFAGYDYVIYAYWQTNPIYTSTMMARELKRYLKKYKTKRIQLVFVNTDRIRN